MKSILLISILISLFLTFCQKSTETILRVDDQNNSDLPFYVQDTTWFSIMRYEWESIIPDSLSPEILHFSAWTPDFFPTADSIVWSNENQIPHSPVEWKYLGIFGFIFHFQKKYDICIYQNDSSHVKFFFGKVFNR